jgi:hypothetical protein
MFKYIIFNLMVPPPPPKKKKKKKKTILSLRITRN